MSALFGVFASIKSMWHMEFSVDDTLDKLNRSFVFLLMVLFGVVVTVRQHSGNVIACDGFKKFDKEFYQDYCWTQGLYTIREAYDLSSYHVPYPGLMQIHSATCVEVKLRVGGTFKCPDPEDVLPLTRVYHLWYQWVPFYFWLVAAAFYAPYLLYKSLGMSQLKPLIRLLHNPLETETETKTVIDKASNWLYLRFKSYIAAQSSMTRAWRRHDLGVIRLVTKAAYLAVVIGTFALTSAMFDFGNFWTYGLEYAEAKVEEHFHNRTEGRAHSNHIRDKLFPKMVACEVKRWGTTGIESEHGTCVLAPNVINQYLFLISWYLLVGVCATNVLSLLCCLLTMVVIPFHYHAFLSLTLAKDRWQLRSLFYVVGTSGRTILMILARQTRQKLMEDIVNQVVAKLEDEGTLVQRGGGRGGKGRGGGGGGGGGGNDGGRGIKSTMSAVVSLDGGAGDARRRTSDMYATHA